MIANQNTARRAQTMTLIATFLGWMFEGLGTGIFPLVARPALDAHILVDALHVKASGLIEGHFGIGAGIIEAELENSAAYLQGWIDALKSKDAKSWIIRAASQAQKAADFIMDVQPEVRP